MNSVIIQLTPELKNFLEMFADICKTDSGNKSYELNYKFNLIDDESEDPYTAEMIYKD